MKIRSLLSNNNCNIIKNNKYIHRTFFTISNIPSSSLSSSSSPSQTRKHYERRLLKYTKEQLFDVVSNIKEYSEFVPWCKESKIISSSHDYQNNNNTNDNNKDQKLLADLVVGFGVFNEKYTSKVLLQRPDKVIAISTETNLLDFLRTEWNFTNANDSKSCWVIFQIGILSIIICIIIIIIIIIITTTIIIVIIIIRV